MRGESRAGESRAESRAEEEAGERAEGSREGPGELEPLTAAVGGEGLGLVPAPFESVPPFEGEVRGEIEMGVELQLGAKLHEAISAAGIFNAQKRKSDAAFEPGKQGVLEARAGDLDVGAIVHIGAVAEEEGGAGLSGAPVFEIGPGPPLVSMEAGGGKQEQEEDSHSVS